MEMPETQTTATKRPVWKAGRPEPVCWRGLNAGVGQWKIMFFQGGSIIMGTLAPANMLGLSMNG